MRAFNFQKQQLTRGKLYLRIKIHSIDVITQVDNIFDKKICKWFKKGRNKQPEKRLHENFFGCNNKHFAAIFATVVGVSLLLPMTEPSILFVCIDRKFGIE